MPHNFYLHSALVKREICLNNDNEMPQFYRTVFTNDTDDAQSDIYHAGVYLGCSFGIGALYVWAIGILAAGQSSTMTGTYAGQFAMESRRIDRRRKVAVSEANKYYFIESAIALFCSFIINVLVMAVFAEGLYGKTNEEVREICLSNDNEMPPFYPTDFTNDTDDAQSDIYHAGVYLGCSFGIGTLYVWAVGILAAGQSSTMTGTYAGQFAMEGFMKLQMPQWKRLLVTRSIAIAPTLAVTVFSGGIQHITGLNDFLNCVQMLQLPFALIPLLTFVADKKLMRDFTCSLAQKIFASLVSVLILIINVYFLYDFVDDKFGFDVGSISIVVVVCLVYGTITVYLKFFPAPKYERFDAPWTELPVQVVEDVKM